MEGFSLKTFNKQIKLIRIGVHSSGLEDGLDVVSGGTFLSSEDAESIGCDVLHITLDLLNNNRSHSHSLFKLTHSKQTTSRHFSNLKFGVFEFKIQF
jgi:hypothetical protein